MKYKVKFRISKGGASGQKFSINLAEGTSFLLGPATVGLHVPGHDDDFSPCMFSIKSGALVVSDRGTKSGIQLNNRSGDEFVLRPGDLIQVVEHSIEILEAPIVKEAPRVEEDAPATRFLDISEGAPALKTKTKHTVEAGSGSISLPGADPDAAWAKPEKLNPIEEFNNSQSGVFEEQREEFQLEDGKTNPDLIVAPVVALAEPPVQALDEFANVQFADMPEVEVESPKSPEYDTLPEVLKEKTATELIEGGSPDFSERTQPNMSAAENLIPQENPMAAFTRSSIESQAPPTEISELYTPVSTVASDGSSLPNSPEPVQIVAEAINPEPVFAAQPQVASVKKPSAIFDIILSLAIAAVGGMVFSFGMPIEFNRVSPIVVGAIATVFGVSLLIFITAILRKFLNLEVSISALARFFGFSVLALVPLSFTAEMPPMIQLGVAGVLFLAVVFAFFKKFRPLFVRYISMLAGLAAAICAFGYSYVQGIGIFSKGPKMQAWNEQQSMIRKTLPAQLETYVAPPVAQVQPTVPIQAALVQAAPRQEAPPVVSAPPGPPPIQVVRRPVDGGTPVQGAQRPVMTDPMGKAKFIQGVKSGDLKLVKEAVQKNGVDPSLRLDNGATGLMFGGVFGHIEVVKYLVTKGADVNARDSAGTTALMWATVNGHKKVVQYLLGHGADRTIRRSDGDTALDIARKFKRKEIATFLLPPKRGVKKSNRVTASKSAPKKSAVKGKKSKTRTPAKKGASTRKPSSLSRSVKEKTTSKKKYQQSLPSSTKSGALRED